MPSRSRLRARLQGNIAASLAAAIITAVLAILYFVVSWSQGLLQPRVGSLAALLAVTTAALLVGTATGREGTRVALLSAAMVSCYALGAITIFSIGLPLLVAGALATVAVGVAIDKASLDNAVTVGIVAGVVALLVIAFGFLATPI